MTEEKKAIDLIASLIFAAVWRNRRQSIGESGIQANAMLKKVVTSVFEGMVGRPPTDEELERMTRQLPET